MMQWNPKKIVVTVAVLAVLWVTTAQTQEPKVLGGEVGVSRSERTTAARLLWNNGDVLPGKLLASKPGKVRWASPHFSDDLVVDVGVLDSILFPKQSAPPTEAFRIATVSGDVWTADLVGTDDNTFLFSSKRHGRVRVNRDEVYTLDRREHPNLVFDGSRLKAWELPMEEEIEDPLLFGADAGGHPQTNRSKASILRALELPKRFEIDLEFASTESPRFVLAFGKNLEQALRLETWANELVVVQDKLFEPMLTIEKHHVRLRLAFDGIAGVMKVFDLTGRLLVKLDGVRPTVEDSGLFIRNRGQALTVQRLSLYRQPAEGAKQQVDLSKPRVHMIDGQVVYGRLFVEEGGAYVPDADGTRRDIALEQVDRIVRPGIELMAMGEPAELTYADGAVLRGRVEQLNTARVILRTTFADNPVTCALAGASQLRLGPTAETSEPGEDDDQLFYPSGRLRGRLSFEAARSPLRWKSVGAAESVRLADTGGARVERGSKRVLKDAPFDTEEFPDVLHLKNGEVIPCQISSYDERTLGFQSPFIKGRKIDSTHVKAIEFKPSKSPEPDEESSSELDEGFGWEGWGFAKRKGDNWLNEILVPEQKTSLGIDPVKLARALTVPRFKRDNPPSHILVANTGDLKRGKLLAINEETIQFESKLQKLAVPINRVARVVDVSKPEEEPDKPVVVNNAADVKGKVRVTLADGSILVFDPLESKDGKSFLGGKVGVFRAKRGKGRQARERATAVGTFANLRRDSGSMPEHSRAPLWRL